MKIQIKSIALAVGLALTAGLTGITGCAGDRYHASTGEYIDDSSITMHVKSKLGDDSQYKFDDVTVTTFKGTVQLSGYVNNHAQKSRAAQLARSVPDVKNVENNITIKN